MVNTLKPHKIYVLWVLCLAQFTLSADVANLSISTATLVKHFQTDIPSIQLLGSILPLIGAALMLSASMLGLIIGWRRLLILGATLGLISSTGFLFAVDIYIIQYFVRPLAGVSSAMTLPAVLALVVAHFPGKQRAVGFGMMAAATGLAAAVIPLLAGWIHDHFHWQWSFVFIVVCYFSVLVGACVLIKPIHTNRPAKFDLLGSSLGAVSIVFIFFGLLKIPYWGGILAIEQANIPQWLAFVLPLSPALMFILLGTALIGCFIYQQHSFEKQYGYALLPISWLENIACRRGFTILSLMYVILGGSSFLIVTYLQVAIGLTAMHSGAIILLFSVAMISASILTPILSKGQNTKVLCCASFTGIAIAAGLLIISSQDTQILISFYLAMIGLGSSIGVLASQCPLLITRALGEREAEQSGGLQATVRNLGLVVGISLLGGINQATLDSNIRSNHEISTYYPKPFVQALQETPHVPYIDNHRTSDVANKFNLDHYQKHYLLSLNASARSSAFNLAMSTLLIIALWGLRVSCLIPTISVANRNTDSRQ
ncbi:MFS transporter [Vibrio astriarenae]